MKNTITIKQKHKLKAIMNLLKDDFILPCDIEYFYPSALHNKKSAAHWSAVLYSSTNTKKWKYLKNRKGSVYYSNEDLKILDEKGYLQLYYSFTKIAYLSVDEKLLLLASKICQKLKENNIKFEWDFKSTSPILLYL